MASDRGGDVGVPRKCLLRIRIVVPAASAASSIQLDDVPEGHRYEDLAMIVSDLERSSVDPVLMEHKLGYLSRVAFSASATA